MATGTLISVEEYLKTAYDPDCDYVDGEVLERNLGEFEHSSTQGEIIFYLKTRYRHLRWRVVPEQRVQVKASRFRIPDVCIVAEHAPREQIVRTSPMLCIEVLAPEDTMTGMMLKIDDYLEMGVPVCWVIDPVRRKAWTATVTGLSKNEDGILRAGEVEMPLHEVLEAQ
jgi:Uma2 family endonuclease